MFNPEEIIVISDSELQTYENFRLHLEIQIPDMPDFGSFEDMPRGPPVLKKHLTDHLGHEEDNNSVPEEESQEESHVQVSLASTPTLPDSEEYSTTSTDLDYVMINVCGYNYKIITTGLTHDEIEEEIRIVENDALDYLLDNTDNRFM